MCYWGSSLKFYRHNLWQYWCSEHYQVLNEDKIPDDCGLSGDSVKIELLSDHQKARLRNFADAGDPHADSDDPRDDGDEPTHWW